MAVLNYEKRRSGSYLGEGDALNIVNAEIKVASGEGEMIPGQILTKVTASGKYVEYNVAGGDGSEDLSNVAILFHQIDATAADVVTVGTVRGNRVINDHMLTYPAGLDAAQTEAVREALRAKGLSVLPQHTTA